MFAENVAGREPYAGHGEELAGYEAGSATRRMHAESLEIFSVLTDGHCSSDAHALGVSCLWKAAAMVEHEVHHRGQLYLCSDARGSHAAALRIHRRSAEPLGLLTSVPPRRSAHILSS